eukprot:scaffold21597_cov56-Phaeocystis_antarctica.AAC.4
MWTVGHAISYIKHACDVPAMQFSRGLTFYQKSYAYLTVDTASNGHNAIICRFARPRHLSRRREQRWRRPAFGTASGGGSDSARTHLRQLLVGDLELLAQGLSSTSYTGSARPSRTATSSTATSVEQVGDAPLYSAIDVLSLTSRASAPVNSAPPAPQSAAAAPASCARRDSGCRRSSERRGEQSAQAKRRHAVLAQQDPAGSTAPLLVNRSERCCYHLFLCAVVARRWRRRWRRRCPAC